ncbi:hypothetical protein CPAV1605_631 [seawater metagenome]|uniref:GDP-fucose protein O-fucosyltransferase n=1 Tax=seawater metagenome TaxID=1561972 RepID=A0A5E8CIJ8_9ZZZZ
MLNKNIITLTSRLTLTLIFTITLKLVLTLLKYKRIVTRNKYLVLIFSDRNGKPSKDYKPTGYGGFCHNEHGYLQSLPVIAKFLNRKAVFPLPKNSLDRYHNNGKEVDYPWEKYLNIDKINNLETNPPFSFSDNGDILTELSIAYYPSNTPIHKMRKNVDVIALVNYNDGKSRLKTYSSLKQTPAINFLIKYNIKMNRYYTSDILKNYATQIISKFKLENFTFIHIRRGDFLDNYSLAPPKGTRPYTSPQFISNFIKIKKKINNKTIIIATNEKNMDYKKKLVEYLDNYKIIFEEELINDLPTNILNDNYCIYLILHEIAKQSKINIGTCGYVRLGDKYTYRLAHYQTDLKLKRKIRDILEFYFL